MRAEKKMNYICFMYVKMIRLDAAKDMNYVKMMTFLFQWLSGGSAGGM